jgi:hypothetical protein
MTDDEPDGRPWTEAQWERFMQQSDARSAKFGELLETLRDDPNCDGIIAHEMGWDQDADEDICDAELDDGDPEDAFAEDDGEAIGMQFARRLLSCSLEELPTDDPPRSFGVVPRAGNPRRRFAVHGFPRHAKAFHHSGSRLDRSQF